MTRNYYFTSESVSEGHPDKICDQISDMLVDEYLKIDPNARLAIECGVTTNRVMVFGETRVQNNTITHKDIDALIRKKVKEIGYEQDGFHHEKLEIDIYLHQQSPDIAQGVDNASDANKEEGAGDQGMMFGFACDETDHYMPSAIHYCHRILEAILNGIKKGEIKDLGPDAKTQLTIEYKNGKPVRVATLVLSIQHKEYMTLKDIKTAVMPYINSVIPNGWIDGQTKFLLNPTGKFVIGGPDGDSGLTGRKIIVDTYGGYCPHGGGAFSGKDATKVDRSAAYAMRYIAKNIVASGLANKITCQVSYAIGVSEPTSFYIDTHGTGKVTEEELEVAVKQLFDLRPSRIKKRLELYKPIFCKTATYGHFGRDPESNGSFSWEKLDMVEDLKKFFNK